MAKLPYKPWLPAAYDKDDAIAVQAVSQGVASDGQQKRFIRWLLYECCHTYDETFFEDSARSSDYAQGKRGVGLQIVKMINLPPDVLNRDEISKAVQPKPTKGSM